MISKDCSSIETVNHKLFQNSAEINYYDVRIICDNVISHVCFILVHLLIPYVSYLSIENKSIKSTVKEH